MGQLEQDTPSPRHSLSTLGVVVAGVVAAVGLVGLGITLPGGVSSAPVVSGPAAVAASAEAAQPVTATDPSVPSAAEALAGHAGAHDETAPTF